MPTMFGYLLEKLAIDEALEKALATPIEKKVADMMANSHEYKKPNIQGALTFVKNYTWEERTVPLSRLQGINKPIKKDKVFEIAKTLEKNGDTVEWPFIVVNKLHGIRPQTHGKVVLMDGHHRMEACKARGIKEVPVYFGTYTGGAEIEDDELYKEVPNEKIANILSKKDIFIEDPDSNVTIVAGFSGSGKSTLSKRLAEETGASHMDIDKAYSMLEDKPSYEDFLRSFVNNSHFSNGKIIIEGVGTSRLDEKDLKGKNVYIKGDGLLKSSLRRGYGENWDGEIGGIKGAFSAFRVNKDMNKDINNLRRIALQNEKTAKDYSEKLKNLRERKDPDKLNYPKRGEFREQCPKDKHAFIYQGGEARCEKCGWFVSPGGEISKTAGVDYRGLAYNKEDLNELLKIIELGDDSEIGAVEYALDKGVSPYDYNEIYPDRGFANIMGRIKSDGSENLKPLGFVEDAYGSPAPIYKRDDSKKHIKNIGDALEKEKQLVESGKGYYGEILSKSKGELKHLTDKNFLSRIMNQQKIQKLKTDVERYSKNQNKSIEEYNDLQEFYDTVVTPAYEKGLNDPNNEAFFWHYASDNSLEKFAEELIEKKIVTQDDLYTVARIVHEINRHYNKLLMDREDPSWDELKDKDKENRISLLSATVPDIKTISAKKMHDMWVDQQAKEGWIHGESYDSKKKTHPCIVSWKELPELEKAKDAMYLAVIKAMTELHFGIDKTIDSKIKEVKIPGGEKVLMNKSATLFGQLLEKQASERSQNRKDIQKILSKQPSSRVSQIYSDIYEEAMEGGRNNEFDEQGRFISSKYPGAYFNMETESLEDKEGEGIYPSGPDEYGSALESIFEKNPDLKALSETYRDQLSKSRYSPVGNISMPVGAIAGATTGVALPIASAVKSFKKGDYLAGGAKALFSPLAMTATVPMGGFAGGIAGAGIGEIFDAPTRGIKYLLNKDYKAYDGFTKDQAQKFKDLIQSATDEVDKKVLERTFGSEFADRYLTDKSATLFGQLLEKQAAENGPDKKEVSKELEDYKRLKTDWVGDRFIPQYKKIDDVAKWGTGGALWGAAKGLAVGEVGAQAGNFATKSVLTGLNKSIKIPKAKQIQSVMEALNNEDLVKLRRVTSGVLGGAKGAKSGGEFGMALGEMDQLDDLYLKELGRYPTEEEYARVTGITEPGQIRKYRKFLYTPEAMVKSEVRKASPGVGIVKPKINRSYLKPRTKEATLFGELLEKQASVLRATNTYY